MIKVRTESAKLYDKVDINVHLKILNKLKLRKVLIRKK